MNLVAVIGVYFVLWWIVLFAVLPFFHANTQDKAGDVTLGTARSAPVRPRLVRVMIVNTIATAVIVGAMWFAVDYYGITLDMLANFNATRP